MPASGKSPTRQRRPRDTNRARPARRPPPLIRRDVVARVGEALARSGAGELGEALIGEADRHAHYLARCAVEAEAVLHGRIEAATRLWLLLREPIPAGPAIAPAVLARIGGDSLRDPPAVLGGDPLLRLVAGAVRAAGSPAGAEAMLDTLGRLLEPFFLLDLAGVAAAQAGHGYREPLDTLVVAWGAPRWAPPPPPPPGGPRRPPDNSGPVVIQPVNPLLGPFEAAATSAIDSWISLWPCLGSTGLKMSTYNLLDPQYAIESIDKPQACPGDTIRISGHDFDPEGLVSFEPPPPSDPVAKLHAGKPGLLAGVKATRWTDTEIDVVVPPWAVAGGVHLNTFRIKKDLCATIYVYRLGNSFPFKGGLALFESVSVAGNKIDLDLKKQINLVPGKTVAIAWNSTGGATAKVKVQIMDGADVLWEQGDFPGGPWSHDVPVPDLPPHEPRSVALVFTVTSACGATAPLILPAWLSVPPNLSITYVEVTQGVQVDLAGVLAGEAMPTVAWKDTAVRLHLSCDRGGWFANKLDRITGILLVDGRQLAPTNRGQTPQDRAYIRISGVSNPAWTDDTLNFTIPAAWLPPGPHYLTVRLVCDDPGGKILVERQIQWTWVEKAAFRVRAMSLGATASDPMLLDELRAALDLMPTPLTDIGIASPRWLPNPHDLKTRQGWGDLLGDVEFAWFFISRTDQGSRWLGVVVRGTPSGTVNGIAHRSGGVGLAKWGMPAAAAHELGHLLGLRHINLPKGQVEGPCFDEADNGGVLRRPPFDVRASEAVPLPAGDFMSYWPAELRAGISTWKRLCDRF